MPLGAYYGRLIRAAFALSAVAAASLAALVAGREVAPRTIAEGRVDGARVFYQGDVPIAVLGGRPEDIGRQHAALLGAPGREVLKFPKKFAAEFNIDFLWPLMAQAGRALMLNAPERHRLELAAISAGGDLDEGALAVGNTLLELRRMGCSVLVVQPEHSATGGPLFGRNFDFPTLGELDKYSVVLVYHPQGRRAFASIAFPGAVGVFSGMNDAGLAVATLDVYQASDNSPPFDPAGVPLAFVFRRILEECATVAQAEELLRSIKPTTWMNLAVCDRDESAAFEITPLHIGRRDPHDGVLACTNHFRTTGLAGDTRCWRYPLLAKAAADPPLDVDAVRQRLHAANQGHLTLQTMVFEPRELALHLAIGKPPTSDDPLTRIELGPLFDADMDNP